MKTVKWIAPFTEAPRVTDQPRVALERWCIVETESGWLIGGFVVSTPRARRTSALTMLDVFERRATTVSGRVYDLVGPSAKSKEAELLRLLVAVNSGWHAACDITDGVVSRE